MKELHQILNTDEKIIWQGKPDFVLYFLSSGGVFILGGFLAVFLYFTLGKSIGGNASFFAIFIPLTLASFAFFYSLIVYKYILYIITDKRMILQSGFIGRDFEFVDYDKVQNTNVNVGILDKIVGRNTGTISVHANRFVSVSNSYTDISGRQQTTSGIQEHPFVLRDIINPYEVLNLFKKVSFDVKADMSYPNAMRPDGNPGYKTKYN